MTDEPLLYRLVRHLCQGTLPERIKEEWHKYVLRRRLAWWQKQGRGSESLLFQLQKGITFRLYFDSQLCQAIYCSDYELNERQFFNDYLRPGDIVVDVGANIGLFTLIASSCVGNQGQVYALEPYSKAYARLVDNVRLNRMSNVQCLQIALSDLPGEMGLNVSLDGYDAWNSIARPVAGNSFAVEAVRATKWDDFVRDYDLLGQVTFLKIDVEGWEGRVLSGGHETFTRNDAPHLQVEFTDVASQSASSSCQTLYRQLEGLGYRMFAYDAKHKRIIPDPLRKRYPYLNLLATKDPQEIESRLKDRRE